MLRRWHAVALRRLISFPQRANMCAYGRACVWKTETFCSQMLDGGLIGADLTQIGPR